MNALPFLFLLAMACSPVKKQSKPVMLSERFDKQGHRGCRGLMPENTIGAMIAALELGVTTLEMDAVITHDGEVILSHEPWMSHEFVTKPDGTPVTAAEERSLNIYAMDYSAVVRYDVGLRPHPRFSRQSRRAAVKPRLSDVFDSVTQYMMTAKRPYPQFNIETKCQPAGDGLYHPAPGPFVERLMEVIRSKGMQDQVIIQSFDIRTLQYLHQHFPSVRTALLIENEDKRPIDRQLSDLGFTPTIYS
ncbi:MAG: hypothetical protein RJA57_1170, partial [Bacteroidota bacterium]